MFTLHAGAALLPPRSSYNSSCSPLLQRRAPHRTATPIFARANKHSAENKKDADDEGQKEEVLLKAWTVAVESSPEDEAALFMEDVLEETTKSPIASLPITFNNPILLASPFRALSERFSELVHSGGVVLLYETGWETAHLMHDCGEKPFDCIERLENFAVMNEDTEDDKTDEETQTEGKAAIAEKAGLKVKILSRAPVNFCLTSGPISAGDGAESWLWDNPDSTPWSNYQIVTPGIWLLANGRLAPIGLDDPLLGNISALAR